jgi:hypothetical protein
VPSFSERHAPPPRPLGPEIPAGVRRAIASWFHERGVEQAEVRRRFFLRFGYGRVDDIVVANKAQNERVGVKTFIGVLTVSVAVLVTASGAGASETSFSARVAAPPEIQRVFHSYYVGISVRNTGSAIRTLCIDFSDDHNSWLIRMRGLRAYDSDTFCVGTLTHGRRAFLARIVPGKAGTKKMSITLGHAKIYSEVNDAIISDKHALYWEDQFVLVG